MADPQPRAATAQDPLRGSRTSGVWVAMVASAVLLLLLVVFIAQNTRDVRLSFLWWSGTTTLSVALLLAAAIGILLTAVVGTLRILQLRRRVHRARRQQTAAPGPASTPPPASGAPSGEASEPEPTSGPPPTTPTTPTTPREE